MTPVRDRSLHTVLWLAQLALAVVFVFTGLPKALSPVETLASRLPWVADVPPLLVRFVGACELAGAAGLVLPGLTGVQPGLTPLAAVALTALMALATVFHFLRGEFTVISTTLPLCLTAAFVAWGRLTHAEMNTRITI